MIRKFQGFEEFQTTIEKAVKLGLYSANMAECCKGENVYIYKFGGFIGGWIVGDTANANTLAEFQQCADDGAEQVWQEFKFELDCFVNGY